MNSTSYADSLLNVPYVSIFKVLQSHSKYYKVCEHVVLVSNKLDQTEMSVFRCLIRFIHSYTYCVGGRICCSFVEQGLPFMYTVRLKGWG